MRSRWMLVPLTLAAMLDGSSLAGAAAKGAANGQPTGMEQISMHYGMMQNDIMGMSECERVLSAAAGLQRPASNEELQLQRQAEMILEMGQAIARYTDEIKEEREKTP